MKFCAFHELTPDKLVKKAPEQLKSMAINYVIHLKKVAKPKPGKPVLGEICVNSVKQYLDGPKSFLDFHEKTLPWKKIKSFFPEEIEGDLRPYSPDEIKKLLTFADLRDRCIILLLLSSGIRVGAIRSLRLKNLTELENGLGFLKVYADSKRDRYTTLVTPEFVAEFKKYKDWRIKHGERVGPESFVIRDKFAPLSKRTNRPYAPEGSSINRHMRRLLDKAGLSYDNIQPDHGFRKFFGTAVRNARVDKDFKRMLMGQSSELDDIYYHADDPQSQQVMMEEYMKAIDALTLNEEHRLKKQVAELKEDLEGAASKDMVADLAKENRDLRQRLEEHDKVLALIRRNPKLALVKPERLVDVEVKPTKLDQAGK